MVVKRKIVVSVINDLVSDNRVHKVCSTLHGMGFNVLLVGRQMPNSISIENRIYKTKRFKLFFKKGPLFYAEYNMRLFLFLLFSRFHVLLANDLDTLTANFFVSKIRRKPLVYDSHEYFTEMPELIDRPRVQHTWELLESKMLPGLKYAYTVCGSIAKVYKKKYGIEFKVIRNLPLALKADQIEKQYNDEKIILYQGAVNIGRGLEQAILSMKYVPNAKLVIAGDGDIKHQLEALVEKELLQDKVEFAGRLPIDKIVKLTPNADLGLSIEEDLGLNYRFALPNKLFDYIQAQVPVLVTNLPEMAAIINRYKVGSITTSLDPVFLAKQIEDSLFNSEKRKLWKSNLKAAAGELIWENEEKILQDIFYRFL